MSTLLAWLFGRPALEEEFQQEVERRKKADAETVCSYRGVAYQCSRRCGHWGVLEG